MERFFRWALVASVVVGVHVALSAGQDAYMAINVDTPSIIRDDLFAPELGLSPDAQRAVWLAGVSGERSALYNMQPWRAATMVLLAIASGLVAAQAFRIRFSAPSASLATLMARFATAAAVLRTVDGAQNLIIVKVMAQSLSTELITQGVRDAQVTGELMTAMFTTGSVMRSLLVVTLFIVIGSYFRSERVKALLSS